MYNILNSISFLNLYTELATVIRLAVVVMFSFFFLIWHPDVYNCHNNKPVVHPSLVVLDILHRTPTDKCHVALPSNTSR